MLGVYETSIFEDSNLFSSFKKDCKLLSHVLTQILHKVESWKRSFLSSNAVDLLLYKTALWADVA